MENVLIKVNVISRDGKKTPINVKEGTTIRDAIEEKLSPEHFGVCGGNCSCGTCHVYVESNDFKKLDEINEEEKGTLQALATEPNKYSRLGCQINLKKEHDNITVTIAPSD
tara:strand:- start:76 stop:408 length:333 start_codon:yes stop_codon:yes gene_type:complete